ncbi:hypothetical protein CEXT_358051 [Caerostris extrusa]|uniref:Uncharacterized protein n=1 Tax=Caerostris extrusa TaxID=172846 RepID=A0AAV4VE75_CAEEX|nr:hypothetical protein CEXT_358051 [Caerostris extrusa]
MRQFVAIAGDDRCLDEHSSLVCTSTAGKPAVSGSYRFFRGLIVEVSDCSPCVTFSWRTPWRRNINSTIVNDLCCDLPPERSVLRGARHTVENAYFTLTQIIIPNIAIPKEINY